MCAKLALPLDSGLSGRRPPVRLSFSYRRSQGMVVTMTARYDDPLSCIVRVCVSRFGCKALCSAFSISLCSVSGEGETQNRASVCLLTQCFKHSLSAPEQPCGVRVFSYLRINRVNIVSDTSNHKSEGKAKNSDQPLFAHPYALYSPSLNCWEGGGLLLLCVLFTPARLTADHVTGVCACAYELHECVRFTTQHQQRQI